MFSEPEGTQQMGAREDLQLQERNWVPTYIRVGPYTTVGRVHEGIGTWDLEGCEQG